MKRHAGIWLSVTTALVLLAWAWGAPVTAPAGLNGSGLAPAPPVVAVADQYWDGAGQVPAGLLPAAPIWSALDDLLAQAAWLASALVRTAPPPALTPIG